MSIWVKIADKNKYSIGTNAFYILRGKRIQFPENKNIMNTISNFYE